MPHINSTQFGEIVIDNKKYHQVLIVGDRVEERGWEKLKKLFDTSHKIGEWEVEKLLSNNPEIIIIGTGQDGAMASEEPAASLRKQAGENIEIIIEPTPKAIEIYNEQVKLGEKVNALIHTTC